MEFDFDNKVYCHIHIKTSLIFFFFYLEYVYFILQKELIFCVKEMHGLLSVIT